MKIRITEIAVYEVDADSQDDGLQKFLRADLATRDNDYLVGVTERETETV